MNLVVTILAGGLGKRMNSDLPKVLHLFKNKPMLIHIIEQSLLLKPKKIVIITGKFDLLIRDTVQKYIPMINLTKISFIVQDTPLGTGHAIKCCLSQFDNNSNVLILNGDTPKINHELLLKFINSSEENSLLTCNIDDSTGYGRIINNDQGNILKIVEEKDASEEEKKIKIINSGIYKIKSQDLLNFIPQIKNNNKQKEYYLTDIIELFTQNNIKIQSYIINNDENKYILGVNTIEQLINLEKI